MKINISYKNTKISNWDKLSYVYYFDSFIRVYIHLSVTIYVKSYSLWKEKEKGLKY